MVVESRQHSLAQLQHCVLEGGCVLVEGRGGCGKSSLVRIVSERWGSRGRGRDLVVLHLGEQVDSKVSAGLLVRGGRWCEFIHRCCWARLLAREYRENSYGYRDC